MKKFIIILVVAPFIFCRCENIKDWSESEKDSVPPGMVIDPVVKNLPGGALITYVLPADNDLLAIKAVYSFTEGGPLHESFASVQTDSIKLEGFPDTKERTVQLISIDKSQNESVAKQVLIQPLTPPVELIRKSMNVQAAFGGVFIKWENPTRADVGVSLYAADSTDNMRLDYTCYSNSEHGQYSFRGFNNQDRAFRVQIRDRWDNYSTPKDTVLKPLFEVKIAGKVNGVELWQRMGFTYPGTNTLPSSNPECIWRGDAAKQDGAAQGFDKVFDGSASVYLHLMRPGNMLSDYTGNTADAETHLVPIYLTMDMGRSSMLSRHKLWHRDGTVLADNNVKDYELWATNTPPKGMSDFANKMESLAYWTSWPEVNGTDGWKNDWTKIAVCSTIPPSGATLVTDVTADDKTWAKANGFETDIFPEYTGTPFRYIRFVMQRNWSAGTIIHIGEIEFWGAYVD